MSKHFFATLLKWSIWSLAIIFFLYEFVLRVLPGAATDTIMQRFDLHASAFGLMIAFYLYAYAPMQLVSGLLIDRFGARIWLSISCLICAIATLIFAHTDAFILGALARLLMGAGSACAFVGIIYLSSHWFEPKYLPWLIGLGNSLGMLGAAIGQGPISFLIGRFGFYETNFYLSLFGFFLAIVLAVVVRNDPPKANKYNPPKKRTPIAKSIKLAFSNKFLWINGIAALFFYAPTVVFGGLWAAPFVKLAYNVSDQTGALASSTFYFGWVIGGPLFGKIALNTKERYRDVILGPIGALISLVALIYFPVQHIAWPFIWLFIAGIFCSAQLLHYTIAVELSPLSIKGTASSLTNLIVFAGGAILMPFVGFVLDIFWDGQMVGLLRLYSIKDYQIALSVFPIGLVIAALISWIKLHKNPEV